MPFRCRFPTSPSVHPSTYVVLAILLSISLLLWPPASFAQELPHHLFPNLAVDKELAQQGEFVAQVTGAVQSVLRGNAVFRPRVEYVNGLNVSSVVLEFENGVSGTLALNRFALGLPKPGVYPLANVWRMFVGSLPYVSSNNSLAFSHFIFTSSRPVVFLSENGFLRITKVEKGYIEGSFMMTATGVDVLRRDSDRVHINVSGTFRAPIVGSSPSE